MLCMPSTLLLLLPTLALASKSSGSKSAPSAGCTGTISSLDDVSAALNCRTININSFKIPGGKTLNLKSSLDNVVMNLLGDLYFEVEYWQGNLMLVGGNNLQFNGNGHTVNANGKAYCGKQKPSPTLHILGSGVVQDLVILNTPAQAVSIQNSEPLLVRNVLVDNRAGDALGRNTDGFGVSSSTGLTVNNCTVHNQDVSALPSGYQLLVLVLNLTIPLSARLQDCIALNSAKNTLISYVNCFGGHGISIGSIQSNQHVTDVRVENSRIEDSEQCFRVKAFANVKEALVQNITYSGNSEHAKVDTKTSLSQIPSTEMQINDIKFTGINNNIEVGPSAWRVGGTCALGKCNHWNFASLKISGGLPGKLRNTPVDSFVSHSSSGSEGSIPTAPQAAPGDDSTDSSETSDPSSQDKSGNSTAGSPTNPDPSDSTPVLATPLPKTHQDPKPSQSHRPKSKHHGHHQGHGSHTHIQISAPR
ncbi:BZ3500_MvSof-1268-A1-R1_Chr1-1g00963 [Microbotryum saponariae]|uniref:BZ3500_MvSof-1268-A1-R1_Chr1-1g00963 protein n=1 Tax=Microbotryum saponariae TaxID=289078 RepID=A0A2X0KHJ7_9BASI|nr:BZ3500_MvSof-1268-A1-R1_Chr1-1g00963 [Microbotryum saponariae]SCZ93042.1 BZ3501_MvSof-1269-A2-R1_Chr1-1g00560 [Microbotryum saponariae]